MQEIKFTDFVPEVELFMKLTANLSKNQHKQESKSLNFTALFLESNELITKLNHVFWALKKYAEFSEFKSLINPLQMKINYYLEALNSTNDRLIVLLQKGSEENDQSCLEYIAESERLINDSYHLINNTFNEKIMKGIERSFVENEGIIKEGKRVLTLLVELRSELEELCREEYICSLDLKKKLENKLATIKLLIINTEGILLAMSNCSFFNISQINSIMRNNIEVLNRDSDRDSKKNEKLKRIVNHIKEVEVYLSKNDGGFLDKVGRVIKERMNIEVRFFNYFLFMDEVFENFQKIFQFFESTKCCIILFNEDFLNKIIETYSIFTEIETNSSQILSINYENQASINKIKENIRIWKENIKNQLFFDEKSLLTLKSKLKIIFRLSFEENEILTEINNIFAMAEKSPRKKKKDSGEKQTLIERFYNVVIKFYELTANAINAKDYIFNFRKQGNVNQITGLDQLKSLIQELNDIDKLLSKAMSYIKEIGEEENELSLRDNENGVIDDGFITEADVVDENSDESLLRLKFKEFLKAKIQKFQADTDSEKPILKDLSQKLKKFIQSSLYS